MPIIEGSASGFRNIPWKTSPLIARQAPAMEAAHENAKAFHDKCETRNLVCSEAQNTRNLKPNGSSY
ncbi:hypothetical protein AAHB56_20885, partial [Bacillus thuringiensis]